MNRWLKYIVCFTAITLSALIGVEGRGSIEFSETSAHHNSVTADVSISSHNTFGELFTSRASAPSITNSTREIPQIVGIFNGSNIITSAYRYCAAILQSAIVPSSAHSNIVSLRKLRI